MEPKQLLEAILGRHIKIIQIKLTRFRRRLLTDSVSIALLLPWFLNNFTSYLLQIELESFAVVGLVCVEIVVLFWIIMRLHSIEVNDFGTALNIVVNFLLDWIVVGAVVLYAALLSLLVENLLSNWLNTAAVVLVFAINLGA